MDAKKDARVILLAAAVLSLLAVLFRRIEWLAALLVLAMLCRYLYCGKLLFVLGRNARKVLAVIAVLIIVQSLFAGGAGKVLIGIGGVRLLTTGGLMMAFAVLCRMLVFFIGAMMVADIGAGQLLEIINGSKLPHEIALMLGMGIRFFPLLREEIQDSWQAIQMRGVDLNSVPWRSKLAVVLMLLMPLLSDTLLRIRRIAYAMELRGYAPGEKRTRKFAREMKLVEKIECGGICLCTILLISAYYLIGTGGL